MPLKVFVSHRHVVAALCKLLQRPVLTILSISGQLCDASEGVCVSVQCKLYYNDPDSQYEWPVVRCLGRCLCGLSVSVVAVECKL